MTGQMRDLREWQIALIDGNKEAFESSSVIGPATATCFGDDNYWVTVVPKSAYQALQAELEAKSLLCEDYAVTNALLQAEKNEAALIAGLKDAQVYELQKELAECKRVKDRVLGELNEAREVRNSAWNEADKLKAELAENKAVIDALSAENAEVKAKLGEAVEVIEKAEIVMRYKQHKHWQMVKQLDGRVLNELIESQDGATHKMLETALASIKEGK